MFRGGAASDEVRIRIDVQPVTIGHRAIRRRCLGHIGREEGMSLRNALPFVLALLLLCVQVRIVLAQDACSTTNLTLPVRMSLENLEGLLERELRRNMSGTEEISISGVKNERIEWSMNRSSIRLSVDHGRLRASTTISGTVRLRGKVRPFGPSFSVSADLSTAARLWMRPTLAADWHLQPNVEANATVQRAEIDIPLSTISVRTQAQRAVNRLVERLESRLNDRIGDDDSLAELGRELWESSHRTFNVATEPPTWIVLVPVRVGATQVRTNNEGVSFEVFVAGSTSVVIGAQPAGQAMGDLPELHISEEQSEGEIELAVPVFVEWEALDSVIANRVRARPVVHQGRSGVLTVHEISLSGREAGALLVSATVSLEPTGWIDRVLSFFGLTETLKGQVVEMSARPALSEAGRSVRLDGVDMTVSSSELLEAVARTYTWLTDQTIESLVEQNAIVDLERQLEDAEAKVQSSLDEVTKGLGERGFVVDVDLRPVTRLSSLAVQADGLRVNVCAGADISAQLHPLDL